MNVANHKEVGFFVLLAEIDVHVKGEESYFLLFLYLLIYKVVQI